MSDSLITQIMTEVQARVTEEKNKKNILINSPVKQFVMPELVGVNELGDTIGLVIPNIDASLAKAMNLQTAYCSLGIIGSRTGAGPHIMSADEGVKASNTEILKIELPRDTKGGAGHGSLIIFGSNDVSDCESAVSVTLEDINRTFGDVYANNAGHLEFQYTARASYACHKAFNAPLDKAFGLVLAAPAAIGVVLCDIAVKAAMVDICGYGSPAAGTAFSNESFIMISGDSAAVRQAIIAAREVGLKLLGAMDPTTDLVSATTSYI